MFEKLKEIRLYEGLTQKEVAEKLGVERSTYAGWETGKDVIPLSKLNDFANIFKVSLDYLVGNTPNSLVIKKIQEINPLVIANNLKKYRKENKLSQKKIAKYLNISQPTFHNYESGKTLITTNYALEFSKQFNYSLDKLVGRK